MATRRLKLFPTNPCRVTIIILSEMIHPNGQQLQGLPGHYAKDVYPNVDVRYYSNAGAVQYDLIVKPELTFHALH
jgi:hypothetical protein